LFTEYSGAALEFTSGSGMVYVSGSRRRAISRFLHTTHTEGEGEQSRSVSGIRFTVTREWMKEVRNAIEKRS
jgi:hypothetical protein